MNPLIFTLAYCEKDADQADLLLQWIQELDPQVKHPCLLVADTKVAPRARAFIKMRAESIFSHVQEIEFTEQPKPQVLRWPLWRFQANQMFLRAAQHVWACCRLPFFWMEADATPLVSGWMDRLAESYYQQPMRYHGPIIIAGENRPAHWPAQHMAGVAMYPMTAVHTLAKYCTGEYTWDLGGGNDVVPQASKCRLIQHNYGPSEHEGWSFEARNGEAVCNHSVQSLEVRKDAVVFHRCKDGSLIRALREMRAHPAEGKQSDRDSLIAAVAEDRKLIEEIHIEEAFGAAPAAKPEPTSFRVRPMKRTTNSDSISSKAVESPTA